MDHDHLASYIDGAFTVEKVRAELEDPGSTFFLTEAGTEPVGYAKLRSQPAPDCIRHANPVELERIYAVQKMVGHGVGSKLMETVLEHARSAGHGSIWLGVWESNARAIRFYEKWGFAEVGEQTFTVGTDAQRDVVFERPLRGNTP